MAEPKPLKPGTAKVLSKTKVAINPKGIEAGTKRRPRIPEGNYLAEVSSAEAGTGKNEPHNPLILWKFRIKGGKYDGTEIWYRTVLIPQSLWSFRQVLEAIKVKVKDATMEIPLDRLKGRTCGIQVVDGEEYQGKVSSEINDIFREELLEGTEEEDEEETEETDEEEEEEETEEEEEEEEVDLEDEEL